MLYIAIHSVYLLCPDPAAAGRPYEQLGLRLSTASGNHRLEVGSPGRPFSLEFMAEPDARPLRPMIPGGSGLAAVALRVADLAGVVAELAPHLKAPSPLPVGVESPAVWLPLREQAGTDIVLIQTAPTDAPTPQHAFPLRRLDHLAAVTPDLEAKTRFWTDVLGVPVAGEVVTPTLVIRQLRIGDAVLELLGPASPASPILQRPPGLVSMASWEVADLDAAVQQARAAGFTAPIRPRCACRERDSPPSPGRNWPA